MSSSSPDDSEPEGRSSLYDPPVEEGEVLDPDATEDHEILQLDIPTSLARRLLEVAHHLSLTPSTVASRAIDLVCDEIGTVDDEPLSSDTLIQQYQARLDILHTLEETATHDDGEEPTWDDVDDIIEAAERGDEEE